MIKPYDYSIKKIRYVDGTPYNLTSFVADEASDITAMNAEGSVYLNYPAGSAALCLADGNVYILNAEETEYIALGGE